MNMINQPLLSVIVPVYNVEPYIRRCVDSIINQTYKSLEIILVDDGSTDNSGKICDECAEKDSRIKVIHKANGGLVSARKAGLKTANGQYAAYVDSDDFIELEMYSCYVSLAVENDADVVCGGKIRDYGTHTVLESESLDAGLYADDKIDFLRKNLIDASHFFKYNISAHVFDKIYKIDLLKKWQMSVPDEVIIGEDASVVYPLMFDAERVLISGKNYYHYCVRSNSIMGSESAKKEDTSYKMLSYVREKVSELNKMTIFEKQFNVLEIYVKLLRDPASVMKFKNGCLFPFGKITKTDKIILYGAGKFGMALKSYLEDNGFNVIAWVDKAGLSGTVKWELARSLDYDKVIVSSLIYETIESIVLSLENSGVAKDKIYYLSSESVK